GIGLVGLTQMAVYVTTSTLLQLYAWTSPGGGQWAGFLEIVSPAKVGYFIVFFLLGYFLYTALFAAVGAVCNSEQEAQNLQGPITWSLMIPMICTIYFLRSPDSTVAVVASLIPLFTPMVMFMRICIQTPPFWQIALSMVLLA